MVYSDKKKNLSGIYGGLFLFLKGIIIIYRPWRVEIVVKLESHVTLN